MKRSQLAPPSPLVVLVRSVVLAPVWFYRRFISPGLPRRCKYEPTCSAYAEQAIRELGVIRGTLLAAWRLVRCNPFSHGGIDDVCDRPFFRAANPQPTTPDHHTELSH